MMLPDEKCRNLLFALQREQEITRELLVKTLDMLTGDEINAVVSFVRGIMADRSKEVY